MNKSLLLIPFFLFSGLSLAEDSTRDLKGIAELIRARTDYQRMLVEEQLAQSLIMLRQAEAELKYAQADYIRKMRQVLDYEFRRIVQEELNVNSKIAQIEWHANQCSGLKIGEVSRVTFHGLRWILVVVIPPAILATEMEKQVPPLNPTNFRANYGGDAKAFPGGNVGKLLKFLETNLYSMDEWSDAHFTVLRFMSGLVTSVDVQIERYHRYMDGIRSGKLDVFKLPKE